MKFTSLILLLATTVPAFAQNSMGGPDQHVLNCKSEEGAKGIQVQFAYVTQALAPELSVRKAVILSKSLNSNRAHVGVLQITDQTADIVTFVLGGNNSITATLQKSPAKATIFNGKKLTYTCEVPADNQ